MLMPATVTARMYGWGEGEKLLDALPKASSE